MTQFGGREMDTSSCLAFAPRNRTGHNGQATQQNWQVSNEDDFLALEPYAVPCGNNWMKDHWDRWQGFSFYSSPLPIDKCLDGPLFSRRLEWKPISRPEQEI
ncbi:unnamed protein product [Effrenium voratum]|uniref:Uncharacterized protein n=1 Tax=Effrenium voratum TaxID=2562239 RepID=A0AA36ICR7_9DINO|nr:unnamed protein product [Effrenium voratum]